MNCPRCKSVKVYKNGMRRNQQQYKCKDCGMFFRSPIEGIDVIKPNKHKMGISKEDFRKKHDIHFRLTQVLGQFEDDIFYEKADLLKMAGMPLSQTGVNTVLESDTFKDYTGKAGGKTYYAKFELIEEMKKEGLLN